MASHLLRALLIFIAMVVPASVARAADTMRVDYYHTGNEKEERFSLDRVLDRAAAVGREPRAPARRHQQRQVFLRGSRRGQRRANLLARLQLHLRRVGNDGRGQGDEPHVRRIAAVPAPARPVRITVSKRDARNAFREIWTFTIDPADKFVEKGTTPGAGALIRIHQSRRSHREARPADPRRRLHVARARQVRTRRAPADARCSSRPSRSRSARRDINVWGLVPPAAQSGISRPSQGIHRRTPVGATYDAFDSERYILTFDNRAFRDIASNAPYDVVEILTNTATYGGGGIFGLYSTVAADSAWAPYLFVHEFGHHIAGLADEYYTSDVAYLPAADRVEPWEPNVTALLRSGDAQVEGRVDGRDAVADALAESGVRGPQQGHPGAAPGHSGRQPAGGRDGRALPRADGARYDAPRRPTARPAGRRIRGRELRGPGLLPATGRLHHVHARRGAVLHRLPAGDSGDPRSLQRSIATLTGAGGLLH